MSEEYKPLPAVLKVLADLRSQVENCDGTAQIDTDAADAVLAAFQASKPLPERVTLATVGESFYHSNAIAHAAVRARITKDELISLLLENEQRLRDVASNALMKTPPIHLQVDIQSPVRLSERKPDLDDCHCIPNSTAKDGAYIWAGSIIQAVGLDSFWNWDLVGRDYMITHSSSGRGATLYTHWLPSSAKCLPARVEG